MLLKIMTNTHKTKIITEIKDAEVWDKIVPDACVTDLTSAMNYGLSLGRFHEEASARMPDGIPASHSIITYDEFEEIPYESEDGQTGGKLIYDVRVVDYLKDGQWVRLLIAGSAYLCNDEGRTIQKIG